LKRCGVDVIEGPVPQTGARGAMAHSLAEYVPQGAAHTPSQ
jgi:hypothetical protein